jgi:dTMP kinase
MRFIAFEGVDGSGKSTLISGLKSELARRQIPFVATLEPGGSTLGQEIRQMLLRVKGEPPVPRAEALLYQAARAQHVETLIRPALKAGQWVLTDRFDASSVAFQSSGRNLKESDIHWLNQYATDGLKPDLYILLDLPVEESLKRLGRRGESADRFEREAQEFHERVRASYLKMAQANPEQWFQLSATEAPAAVLKRVVDELLRRQWLK